MKYEEARLLLTHIDQVHRDTLQQALRGLATKEDLANLRAKLLQEIAHVRADLLKWMFVFWIGQVGVISGIFFTLLNFYMKP